MAEDLEKKGHQAFVDEDFEEAVNLYTEALSLEPQNAAVLSSRAAAHTKLENYTGTGFCCLVIGCGSVGKF